MHESRDRLSRAERQVERVQRQFRAQVIGHRPAVDPARAGIEEHDQVQPALPCRDRRAIPDPHGIAFRRREVAGQEIRGGQTGGLSLGWSSTVCSGAYTP